MPPSLDEQLTFVHLGAGPNTTDEPSVDGFDFTVLETPEGTFLMYHFLEDVPGCVAPMAAVP